jgi:hypothetical protein
MKKHLILAVLLAACPVAALATSLGAGIGFHNVAVNGSSLPAGMLSVDAIYHDRYVTGLDLVAGHGNGITYDRAEAFVGRTYSVFGGVLTQRLLLGFERTGFGTTGRLSAGYAGAGVVYTYPITHDIAVSVSGYVGRDFGTASSMNPNTTGGLSYSTAAAVDFGHIGPGIMDISYRYRRLPINGSQGLTTSSVGIGYHIGFD